MSVNASILICARKRLPWTKLALPSVVAEDPAEIVFVNDGPADGTREYVESVVPAEKLIYEETGRVGYAPNPFGAWNLAGELATKDILIHHCAECAVVTPTFGQMVNEIKAASNPVIVLARVLNVPVEDFEQKKLPSTQKMLGSWWEMEPCNADEKPLAIAFGDCCGYRVYCGNERPAPLMFSGALRREVWEGNGRYDSRDHVGADVRFARRALKNGVRFLGLGMSLVLHLEHGRE